jgi:AcrR family transcriptional regulator
MPPAISFTKDDIINATFEIYKDIGIEKITVRKIANKLGCSIAPIYSNFKNIEDVRKNMMEKTFEVLLKYTERNYSSNVFLNIGLGILTFAKDYKSLYKTLFINSNQYFYLIDESFQKNLQQMKKEESLRDLNDDEIRRILEKTRLFTHGLATFICSGNMKDKSDTYFFTLMKEVGEDIIGYTLYKKRSSGRGRR